jgi:hypothetical protein
MPRPLIYIVRAELVPDFVEPHHDWYARKHAPDVLGVGFLSARGYDATTAPHMWNIYEVPNVEIFSLDIYNNMHKNDPFVAIAIPKLQGRTVSVFTQVVIADGDGRETPGTPTFSGPRLVSLRFDTDSQTGQAEEWFRGSVVAPLAGKPGINRIRLWEQQQSHPKWQSTEPRWSVAVETNPEADEALVRSVLDRSAQAIRARTAKIDVADKRYALVREDLFDELR